MLRFIVKELEYSESKCTTSNSNTNLSISGLAQTAQERGLESAQVPDSGPSSVPHLPQENLPPFFPPESPLPDWSNIPSAYSPLPWANSGIGRTAPGVSVYWPISHWSGTKMLYGTFDTPELIQGISDSPNRPLYSSMIGLGKLGYFRDPGALIIVWKREFQHVQLVICEIRSRTCLNSLFYTIVKDRGSLKWPCLPTSVLWYTHVHNHTNVIGL